MGAVHKQHRCALEELQPPLPAGFSQAFDNGTLIDPETGMSDQFHGTQRQSGIGILVPPRKRADKSFIPAPDAAV